MERSVSSDGNEETDAAKTQLGVSAKYSVHMLEVVVAPLSFIKWAFLIAWLARGVQRQTVLHSFASACVAITFVGCDSVAWFGIAPRL